MEINVRKYKFYMKKLDRGYIQIVYSPEVMNRNYIAFGVDDWYETTCYYLQVLNLMFGMERKKTQSEQSDWVIEYLRHSFADPSAFELPKKAEPKKFVPRVVK